MEWVSAVSNGHMQSLWCVCSLLTSALAAGFGSTPSAHGAWANSGETAQPDAESSNLWFSARVAHGDQVENAWTYRLYDEPRELVIVFRIGYGGLQAVVADQQDFARALRVAMKDEEKRPVAVKADGTFWRFAGADRVMLNVGEPLHVGSEPGLEWELRLQRVGGQRFAEGRHTLEVSLAGPFAALRLADGSAPRSRRSPEAILSVRFGPPTDARERSGMHGLVAREAMEQGRYAEGATAAQRAIDADPLNAGAYIVLGDASLRLNRCAEAAAALERVLTVGLVGKSHLPERLVQAYVCVGDEQNARRVLRLRGVPEAQIDAEIERYARLQEVFGGKRR